MAEILKKILDFFNGIGVIGSLIASLIVILPGIAYYFLFWRRPKKLLEAVLARKGTDKVSDGEKTSFKRYVPHKLTPLTDGKAENIPNQSTSLPYGKTESLSIGMKKFGKALAKPLDLSEKNEENKKSESGNSVDSAVQKESFIVILAEAGFGKTILMNKLVYGLLQKRSFRIPQKEDRKITLKRNGIYYGDMRNIADKDIFNDFKSEIASSDNGESCYKYVFLDGLDECPLLNFALRGAEDGEYRKKNDFLKEFWDMYDNTKEFHKDSSIRVENVFVEWLYKKTIKNCQIERAVVSSRPFGISPKTWRENCNRIANGNSVKAGVYTIDALSEEQAVALAKKYSRKRGKELKLVLKNIRADFEERGKSGAESVFSIPFFVANEYVDELAGVNFKKGRSREEAEKAAIKAREKEEARKACGYLTDVGGGGETREKVEEAIRNISNEIGTVMLETGLTRISGDKRKELFEKFKTESDGKAIYDKIYDNLLESRCLLIPDGEDGGCRFLHKILYENITARALIHRSLDIRCKFLYDTNGDDDGESLKKRRRAFACYCCDGERDDGGEIYKNLCRYVKGFEEDERKPLEKIYGLLESETAVFKDDYKDCKADELLKIFPFKNPVFDGVKLTVKDVLLYLSDRKLDLRKKGLRTDDILRYFPNAKEIDLFGNNFEYARNLEKMEYAESVILKNCGELKEIALPKSVKKIGEGAFENCGSLAEIKIPESVTKIDILRVAKEYLEKEIKITPYYAFYGCHNLKKLDVEAGNEIYSSVDGVLYNKAQAEIICYPMGKPASDFTIPDGVTKIAGGAFYNCKALTGIKIPDGVTKIADFAFNRCGSLRGIKIPESVTEIGDGAFNGCGSLSEIKIPESVTEIGDGAFAYCGSLSEIKIPDGVKKIGEKAFLYCENLERVYLSKNTKIGYGAFDCANPEFIYTDA
ncbi:MAG: leucine-rich repeat domain-containing protein [Clostridiales bacterium]|jgi:hypothetical protein|nr:leucine-rich repeat domain-containing protein [Clostridiales bacterium]